jgi:hypothetical protein
MLRGSSQRQERVLMTIGAVVVLCIVLAITLAVVNPFAGKPKNVLSVAITTPYVGQGVEPGTAVVLHGVKVGSVTDVTNSPGGAGGVQLDTELQSEPVRGLTDAMNIDFRPINYFGVPGINLVPASGGQALRDGARISLVPTGNFTLSELLNQLGNVSQASLTPQLISVIDRVTRYTDGLNPLFETAVTVARAVKAVQTVPTERLMTNFATAVAAAPPFFDATVIGVTRIHKFDYYPEGGYDPAGAAAAPHPINPPYTKNTIAADLGEVPNDYWQAHFHAGLDLAGTGLFASVGKLVGSHVDDLFPLISGLKAVTDTGPVLLRPLDVAQKLSELRDRFERLYAGNGDQRAVSVRILLDGFPAVAAPMGIDTEGTP